MTAPLRRSARHREETGAFLILWAVLLVGVMTMVAILVDLSNVRSSRRADQTVVDLAALAAGKNLAHNNPSGACQDAIAYINANTPGLTSSISASSFCAQTGNNVGTTTCSGGSTTEAMPSTTVGRYTVSVHYPVPASEIQDATYGTGLNDGTACQRLRVIMSSTDKTFFGGIVGSSSLTTTRSATVKPSPSTNKIIPALWLLDPWGCTSLSVSGGSSLTVGSTSPVTIPGVISIDSIGTSSPPSGENKCTSNQTTIASGGSGTAIHAVPNGGTNTGSINLFALPPGALTCSGSACNPSDVSGGYVSPQPVSEDSRATRAPVDWQYNCKTGYPNYHSISIVDCANAGSTPPYLDNLKTAARTSGNPDTGASGDTTNWKQFTAHGYSCNGPGNLTLSGNWWIDCSTLKIQNGDNLTLTGGNVVMDGALQMTGGTFTVNSGASGLTNLTASCLPPIVITPCIDSSSAAAAFLFQRSGDMNITGGTPSFDHAFVYTKGYVQDTASPTWLAPTEGPFTELALWSDLPSTSNNVGKFQMNGGATVNLFGTFFTPEAAPFTLAGGGTWAQQSAQFISYQFAVSGGSNVQITPNANNFVAPPVQAGVLIR